MHRRILLIDADSGFHTSVAKQLARFRFDIFNEPDGDRAHALATAELPALIIVAVDEPDKLGFKIFQKLRKGATSKVPIMLVTASMTVESFAKHRGLKVHADDYLDKRTQSDELLGKVEQLIGLGEPVEDDIDIPLEDDIPLVEGDMVLEETIGEDDIQEIHEPHAAAADADEFDEPHQAPLHATAEPAEAHAPPQAPEVEEPEAEHEFDDAHNAGTRNMQVDQLVDAEIDAGFAAMFGEESLGAPIAHEHEHEQAPEPAPEPPAAQLEPDEARVRAPIEVANESVPVAIQDGGRREEEHAPEPVAAVEDSFDSFEAEPARPPSGSRTPVAIDDDVPVLSRDLIAVEELAAEADDEDRGESTQVQAPHPAPPSPPKRSYAATTGGAPRVTEPTVDSEAEREFSMHDMVTRAAPVNPKLLEELSIPVAVAHVNRSTGDTMAPPFARHDAIDPPTTTAARPKRESMQAIVDLGLDEVAERAESEQSGVHDRRSLQRVGELERQVAQLKTELERARSTAGEKAGTSRAGEFVNLREQITARDKELQKAKDELAARDREVKDALEKARQALHARNAVESKASELDQLRTNDLARIAALEGREKAMAGQVAALKDELDARTTAAAAAEQMRLQIERDLAAERARAAAGASDAERSLRLEREQLIGRHQGEIAAARVEAERLREVALATLRAELEADAAKAAAAADEVARKVAQGELDKAKAQLAQQHAAELAALASTHAEALARASAGTDELRAQHAAAVATLAAEHAQQLADHQEEHAILTTRAQDAHAAELARAKQAHDAAIAAAARTAHEATAAADAQLDQAQAELEAALADAEGTVAAKVHAHGAELDRLRAEHRAELDKLRATLETARAEDELAMTAQAGQHAAQLETVTAAHAEALAGAKAELERQAAAHDVKLDVVRGQLDSLATKHEAAKAELAEGHRRATDALAATHAGELAKVAEDRQRAIDEAQKAAAEHRAATERMKREADDELARQREAAEREAAESRAALLAAKRTAEEAAARHQAEGEAAKQAHDKGLAEQKAQHERALALAGGDLVKQKAVSDAEHAKALAAMKDELDKQRAELEASHQRGVVDLQRERDELQKGLSSMRETAKRVDSELASAVQTIADRNAELRGHTAAIAERDQRIAELRKELDSLEAENASYQEQVLRAYQKIKTDEAMVARAKKAMAIALTVLDDQGNPS